MTKTNPFFINGKFTAQAMSGVQRVATSLVRALDQSAKPGDWVLLCPPGATVAPLNNIEVRIVGPTGLSLTIWEQFLLPWVSRKGYLISLAGSAPALARRCGVFIHDAAVFDRPKSYRLTFVAWYRALFRWFSFRGVAIATPSAFSRAALSKVLRLDQNRITVIPCGADHFDHIDPCSTLAVKHGLEPRGYLIAVGHANPEKNLATLLKAFESGEFGALRLVVVGAFRARAFKLGSMHEDHPLLGGRQSAGSTGCFGTVEDGSKPSDQLASLAASAVLYTGSVDDATLVHLYRNALMLVFPSTYEGFGLPPLEAMSQGCPVVAIRQDPMLEVLGDAAFYAESATPQSISLAISKLAFDEDLQRKHYNLGLDRARQFRWADAAKRLQNFADLVAQGSA